MKEDETVDLWEAGHERLLDLEGKLIRLIAKTNNPELMDAFCEWQEQRNECNDLYIKWLKSFKEDDTN